VNVFINTWFASWLENGTVYRLGIAFRLMQLPLGIFGVAIGTVTLPLLSRIATTGNRDEFGAVLGRGMRFAFVLTLPATVGLVMLARPIISLLYEHGKFNAHATDQAAIALQGYAIGLCAYSVLKILSPAFYAIDKRRTPMVVSFISIGLNVAVNWFLAFYLKMGILGLSVGTGCVATTNFLMLYFLMQREAKLGSHALLVTIGKLAVASAALAAVCWAAQVWVLGGWKHWGVLVKIAGLFGTIGVGALVYFFAALALRVEELDEVTALAKRKLGRFARKA
jgi:putative peptidoglycan lipid II flippase